MKTRIVAVLAIAALHFALTIYALGQADVSEPTDTSRVWGKALSALGVPVLHAFAIAERQVAIPRLAGLDWMPLVMVLNSLFWGVVVVALFVWLRRRRGERPAAA